MLTKEEAQILFDKIYNYRFHHEEGLKNIINEFIEPERESKVIESRIESSFDNPRIKLIKEFESASEETLFPQQVIAAVLFCKPSSLEQKRWSGTGIPFLKINRRCLYRKKDVLEWLNKRKSVNSTSQY